MKYAKDNDFSLWDMPNAVRYNKKLSIMYNF